MPGSVPQRSEVAEFRAARGGDVAARERLVVRYLPLARSIARRFASSGEPFEDLLQVASLGLLHAVTRFDPDRGRAFSSFAVPTIAGEVRRHFRDRTWAVRMPRELQERTHRVRLAADVLARRGGQPTVAQLAEATGLSTERVLEALQAASAYSTTSLEAPAGPDDTEGLVSALGNPEAGYAEVEARVTLEAAASGTLTRRQRRILALHLDELTQDEIARRVGISQMQVSRDLSAARAALRAPLAA